MLHKQTDKTIREQKKNVWNEVIRTLHLFQIFLFALKLLRNPKCVFILGLVVICTKSFFVLFSPLFSPEVKIASKSWSCWLWLIKVNSSSVSKPGKDEKYLGWTLSFWFLKNIFCSTWAEHVASRLPLKTAFVYLSPKSTSIIQEDCTISGIYPTFVSLRVTAGL